MDMYERGDAYSRARLTRRTFVRLRTGELSWRELAPRHSPIAWGAALWRMHQREIRAYIRERRPGMGVVVLRSPKAAARFLADAAGFLADR